MVFAVIAATLILAPASGAVMETPPQTAIAVKGKPSVDIVVADNLTPAEVLARKELSEHLRKIVGAEFATVKESDFKDARPAIYLGQTAFAKKNGVDFSKLGEEDMIIKTVSGGLIISGGRPRGTLYATYEFLERYAGVRWLSWDTTVIPDTPDFSVPAINVSMKPAFSRRYLTLYQWRLGGGDASKKFSDFHLRNRGQSEWNPDIGGPLAYNEERLNHTFYLFVDPKDWFEKHPEYYSMNEQGKRTCGNWSAKGAAGTELCLSNPELPGVMAEGILKYIKEHEASFAKARLTPTVVDIDPEDSGSYLCKCPDCVAISKEEGSESGLLIRFANKVSDILVREKPGVKVRAHAYVYLDKAPLKVKAVDNVSVMWVDLYSKSDPFRPLEHPVNKGQLELLLEWSKTTKNIEINDYWLMGGEGATAAVPQFIPVSTLAADARLFRKANASGYFVEFEMGVTEQSFYWMDVWAARQLYHNPDLQTNELVSTFISGYYGGAAAPMREYHDLLENALLSEKESMDASHQSSSRSYLTMDFLSKCRGILLKAEAAVPPESKESIHVRQEMIVVYNCILNQWARMKRQNGKEFPFSKKETLEKYEEMRKAVIDYTFAGTERQTFLLADLKSELASLNCDIPLPEQFQKLPDDAVLDYTWTKLPSWTNKKDADAAGGKANYWKRLDSAGVWERAYIPFSLYDRLEKRFGPTLQIKDISADEKYHLYKMGKFKLGKNTIITGHGSCMMLVAYLTSAYINDDGRTDNPNEWDFYISVKVTGPLYVPGSKQENALWVDRVILVKPGKN